MWYPWRRTKSDKYCKLNGISVRRNGSNSHEGSVRNKCQCQIWIYDCTSFIFVDPWLGSDFFVWRRRMRSCENRPREIKCPSELEVNLEWWCAGVRVRIEVIMWGNQGVFRVERSNYVSMRSARVESKFEYLVGRRVKGYIKGKLKSHKNTVTTSCDVMQPCR